MTHQMLAYCGLSCAECPAYLAKRNDDESLRIETAKAWSSDDFSVAPADINCDGCTAVEGIRWTWCKKCTVRLCAAERDIRTCAACPNYGCDTLDAFLEMAGDEAHQRLENIRETL